MPVKTASISLHTNGNMDVQDITRELVRLVEYSGLQSGTLTVFCPYSTSGLTTLEFEPGALADLKRMFEELVPSQREYAHNATWEDGNGHSHMRAAPAGRLPDRPLRGENPHAGHLAAGHLRGFRHPATPAGIGGTNNRRIAHEQIKDRPAAIALRRL